MGNIEFYMLLVLNVPFANRYAVPPDHGKRLETLAKGNKIDFN